MVEPEAGDWCKTSIRKFLEKYLEIARIFAAFHSARWGFAVTLIPEVARISVPLGLSPEKHASRNTVTDFAGIFARLA